MLDVVLSEVGDIDEKMGLKGSNDLTIPFKFLIFSHPQSIPEG